jgi:TonB-linked SusC/RagA family outer membrane protein
MLASSELWAQERIVSGKVTASEDGSPLPGVNVVLKGTTSGAVTDADGKYSVNVPAQGGILVFSFIGLKSQEIEIGTRTSVDIQMEQDATQLSEVVITAGGLEVRTKELGSAQAVVTPQSLTAGRAVNLAAGLQGKVAGFQINATSSGVNPEYRLLLRGQRSLTGNNQALVVLDNVIVPNAVLSNLNMNDVESVNVLQGAGAAAIYGSQASNGAVIITTKKGKKGVTEVNVSQNIQFTQVAFFPKIQKSFGAGGSAYGTDPDGQGVFNYLENQSYGDRYDNSLRPLGPMLEDGTQLWTPYNYKAGHNDFWKIGATNQTDFSVSSGDEKSTFMLSGQYVTVTGTTPGDEYKRGNIRINGTRKVTDKLMATYTTSFAPSKADISSATATMYDNMLNMPSNVDITKFKNWRTDPLANPNGFYNPWYQNPYFSAETYRQTDKNNYLTGNLELKFTPVKGLDFVARQGISNRTFTQKTTTEGFKYTTYAKNTDQSSKTDIPASVGEFAGSSTQLVSDLFTQFDKTFGSINLNVVAGGQYVDNKARLLGVNINGLVVDKLYNLANGTGTPTYGEGEFHTALMGAYGKVTLGYKDFLFLTGTARNDWDSRLNKANRSFFYPSSELSFVLSDAFPSIKDNGMLNFLKLRASLSKTGQVNIGINNLGNGFTDLGAYQTRPTFNSNLNGFPYASLAGYSVGNRIVDKNIKPEFTTSYEFGTDFNMWDDKLVASVTYYHSNTINQTTPVALSSSTGFTTLLTNVGETSSKGLEAALHITPVRSTNWNITFGGNYTYLRNDVVSISTQLPLLALATSNNATSAAIAGQPFPVIMGLDYKRDPQGRVIVDPVTGLPSSTTSNVILGQATPKHRIGVDANVSYKNIRFSVLFEYRTGYKIYNGIGSSTDWSGTGYRTALYDRKAFIFPNSVTDNGDGTYTPNTSVAIANGNGNNGFWSDGINRNTTSNYVTSGTFVKLREIALAYDLPKSLVAKTKILKGATFSVQGRNLFLWMAKDNYYTDPEYSSAGVTGNGSGLNDIGQTPPARYFGGTLSLKL